REIGRRRAKDETVRRLVGKDEHVPSGCGPVLRLAPEDLRDRRRELLRARRREIEDARLERLRSRRCASGLDERGDLLELIGRRRDDHAAGRRVLENRRVDGEAAIASALAMEALDQGLDARELLGAADLEEARETRRLRDQLIDLGKERTDALDLGVRADDDEALIRCVGADRDRL